MNTFTQNVTSFRTAQGNDVVVKRTKRVGDNGTFRGFGETVRTFAVVNGEVEVEVETGAAFRAASAVRDAGF